jgi:hypothetical protein
MLNVALSVLQVALDMLLPIVCAIRKLHAACHMLNVCCVLHAGMFQVACCTSAALIEFEARRQGVVEPDGVSRALSCTQHTTFHVACHMHATAASVCVRACACACVHLRGCVRACACACVRICVRLCVRACMRACAFPFSAVRANGMRASA